jgi:hypothetical protein
MEFVLVPEPTLLHCAQHLHFTDMFDMQRTWYASDINYCIIHMLLE